MKQQRVGIPTTIFVGTGFDSDDVPIVREERDDIRYKIRTRAVELFGGVTIVDAQGSWMDDYGKVIEEKVMQVIIYSRRPNGCHPRLGEFIRFILSVSRQTSVLVDDRASPEAYLAFQDSTGSDGVEQRIRG